MLHRELVDDDENVVIRALGDVLTSRGGSVEDHRAELRAVDLLKLGNELVESHLPGTGNWESGIGKALGSSFTSSNLRRHR